MSASRTAKWVMIALVAGLVVVWKLAKWRWLVERGYGIPLPAFFIVIWIVVCSGILLWLCLSRRS